MDLNYIRELIDTKASYNFFGMPKRSHGKTGQGKIVHIEAIILKDTELLIFILETKQGVQRVPASCITKFHKKRKQWNIQKQKI